MHDPNRGAIGRAGISDFQKSRRDRVRAKLREIKDELRRRMHQPVAERRRWLKQVVTGVFVSHAVPTNSRALVRALGA